MPDHPRPGPRGLTIFLTTLLLDEADQLAKRIAILDQGKLPAGGTISGRNLGLGAGEARSPQADPSPNKDTRKSRIVIHFAARTGASPARFFVSEQRVP